MSPTSTVPERHVAKRKASPAPDSGGDRQIRFDDLYAQKAQLVANNRKVSIGDYLLSICRDRIDADFAETTSALSSPQPKKSRP